ncbi:hypothetical protein ACVWZR_002060 [Bradyrhizobium sp. i1.3.1]
MDFDELPSASSAGVSERFPVERAAVAAKRLAGRQAVGKIVVTVG